ncbi:hypothetical protein M427DRAFT_182957 [Gonapodya prolifera JEL478]|uniref:Uncharacterized protein n=1 Tax=Gonapodya prolifera (strain JEL478) TaxID=1344416 RepID=A0A139A0R3_GONPJ|nr:hypothetical protein M427DRAFT_182957 [Gonapodya prolifera JEL478]|eukprot:KXS10351.1 hypothetical protein M427DRAFT_182957 [Gonapodya prolifera JEL478]
MKLAVTAGFLGASLYGGYMTGRLFARLSLERVFKDSELIAIAKELAIAQRAYTIQQPQGLGAPPRVSAPPLTSFSKPPIPRPQTRRWSTSPDDRSPIGEAREEGNEGATSTEDVPRPTEKFGRETGDVSLGSGAANGAGPMKVLVKIAQTNKAGTR